MDEPCSTEMTPLILNQTRNDLIKIFNEEIASKPSTNDSTNKDNIFHQDLNQIVADLEDNPEGNKQKQGRRRRPKVLVKASAGNGSKQDALLGKRPRAQIGEGRGEGAEGANGVGEDGKSPEECGGGDMMQTAY